MALTDTDHLPFSTITGATTFNDWRRITNGLGKDIEGGIQTGSHLYLGNYDWSGRVSRATRLPAGVTTGTETGVDTVWDPGTSVSYDPTEGGVRFTLGSFPDQTRGTHADAKMRMWARIQTRMPIDEFANYRVKVRIKNLRTSGTNRIYLGFIGLNGEFQALLTDQRNTFNYGLASAYELANADVNGGVTEFSAVISGFNTETEVDSTKFDPGTKFADIIFINQYVDVDGNGNTRGDPWVTTQDDVIIQNIEIERMPSGIIITEHDSQDNNPRTALQIGYSTEQTYVGTATGTGIGLDVNSSAQIRGALMFNHAAADHGGNTNIDHIYHADTGNSFHFESDNSLRSQEGAYTRNGHKSTLRAGRIVADMTHGTIGHSSLADTLYISKDVDYSGDAGEHDVSPMLVLAVAGDNAASTGAGPSIDFYIPDSTASELNSLDDVDLNFCGIGGRIACEKSETGALHGSGDLVLSARKNAGTMQELLRLHPALGAGGKQGVTVGDESSNTKTDLDVTGSISTINGVDYTWPTSDAGGTVDGTKKILTYSNGALSWQTLSNATTNQTVFVQNQTLPIGSIIPWAGDPSKIPVGEFVECNGQSVQTEVAAGRILSTEVAALYAAIGNQYGIAESGSWSANGVSYVKFKLPDLRKKVAVGRQGSTVFDTGDSGGSHKIYVAARTQCGHTDSKSTNTDDTKLTVTQSALPSHTHDTPYGMLTGNYQGPQQNENAGGYDGGGNFHLGISALARTTTSAGSSDPLSITTQNIQPFIALTYIIKAEGSTIVTQNLKPENGLLLSSDGGATYSSNTSNILQSGADNRIKLDVDSNDFEFSGNQLKLAANRPYRSGSTIQFKLDETTTEVSHTVVMTDSSSLPVFSGTGSGKDAGFSITMTPTSTSSIIRVTLKAQFRNQNANDGVTVVLFEDSVPVGVSDWVQPYNGYTGRTEVWYFNSADTTEHDYTVRFGGDGSHATTLDTSPTFGGLNKATLFIEEIAQ